jgi:ATP-binding cassette subfamily F protein 3
MGFEGTALLVSHDRRFLENVTTRVVSLRDGRIDVYPGGFREYERIDRPAAPERAVHPPETRLKEAPASQEAPKQRYEAQRQAARTLEKKKRRVQELEAAITSGERDLDALRVQLKSAPGDDWEALSKMAHEEQALTKRVDAMLMEWARLSEETQ